MFSISIIQCSISIHQLGKICMSSSFSYSMSQRDGGKLANAIRSQDEKTCQPVFFFFGFFIRKKCAMLYNVLFSAFFLSSAPDSRRIFESSEQSDIDLMSTHLQGGSNCAVGCDLEHHVMMVDIQRRTRLLLIALQFQNASLTLENMVLYLKLTKIQIDLCILH